MAIRIKYVVRRKRDDNLSLAKLALQRSGQPQEALAKAQFEQVAQVLHAPQVLMGRLE
jgi:hypothetical protein